MPTIIPPLTSVTPTDQTGIIAVLTAFSLGLTLLSIAVRLYMRLRASTPLVPFILFLVCAATGLASVATTLYGVSRGLGKSVNLLSEEEVRALDSVGRASAVLYLATLGASKMCCAGLYVALTPFTGQRRVAWSLGCVSAAWMVASVFAQGFGCAGLREECAGRRARWIGVSTVDMLTEAALVGTSVYMVWARSMCVKAKWTVVVGFACRLPNIALTLTHLFFILFRTSAPTSAISTARIRTTAQLSIGYTIVSCVIPYLRPLMQSYETEGVGYGREEMTFKLSDRSRLSDGSVEAKEAVEGKGKGKERENDRTGGLELSDPGALLGPARPVLAQWKSREAVERATGQAV